MSRSRQYSNLREQRRSRREQEERARRRTRRIIGAAAAVLVLAFGIILAGLYFTQYRPPREHVLTVGDREYQAGEVRELGRYFALAAAQDPGASQFIEFTLEQIERDEILRQRAPELVGEVTTEDVEQELRERLGFAPPEDDSAGAGGADSDQADDDEGDATPDDSGSEQSRGEDASPTATTDDASDTETASSTGSASAEPTDTAEPEDDGFAAAYDASLESSRLSREQLEEVIAAQIYAQRLRDLFREDFDTAGSQLLFQGLTVGSPALAEEARQRAVDGEDFTELYEEYVGGEGPVPEPMWFALDELDDDLRATVEGVEAGGVSEVVDDSPFYRLFYVTDRDDSREFTEAQLSGFAQRELEQWLDEQREQMEIERDLSTGEERWIRERIIDDLS